MTTTQTVKWEGVDTEVEFYYTPYSPATFDEPAQAEEIEIISIKINGGDIGYMLSDEGIEFFELELFKIREASKYDV